MKIETSKVVFALLAILIAAAVGYLCQPLIHDHDKVVGIVIDVFAILAGFLITIMTLLGEPGVGLRSWRSDATKMNNIRRRLIRHAAIFYLYMATLLAAVIYSMLDPATCNLVLKTWLERSYLFLASLSFLLSLVLPMSLAGLQLAKQEELIGKRRGGRQS